MPLSRAAGEAGRGFHVCHTPFLSPPLSAGAGVSALKLDSAQAIAYKISHSSTSLDESITW
jgi:hypothetical protein